MWTLTLKPRTKHPRLTNMPNRPKRAKGEDENAQVVGAGVVAEVLVAPEDAGDKDQGRDLVPGCGAGAWALMKLGHAPLERDHGRAGLGWGNVG